MCVAVTLLPDATLTSDEIDMMARANSDGIGLSWADGTGNHWVKDLNMGNHTLGYLLNTHAVKYPRLLHFRYATAGGKSTALCHPFTLNLASTIEPYGVTDAPMVIHNGHWGKWDDILRDLKKEGYMVPEGPVSDTRFAVYLAAAAKDRNWLDNLGGKVAVMETTGEIEYRGTWEDLRPGVKVSNTYWDRKPYVYTSGGSYWDKGGYQGGYQYRKTPATGVATSGKASGKAVTASDALGVSTPGMLFPANERGTGNPKRTASPAHTEVEEPKGEPKLTIDSCLVDESLSFEDLLEGIDDMDDLPDLDDEVAWDRVWADAIENKQSPIRSVAERVKAKRKRARAHARAVASISTK